MISVQLQTASYLFASILFILSLGGLSSQESAKRGIYYGIIGMIIAILSTVLGEGVEGQIYIVVAIAIKITVSINGIP
jgi:NAD(P) transhydrogenase subunit beta